MVCKQILNDTHLKGFGLILGRTKELDAVRWSTCEGPTIMNANLERILAELSGSRSYRRNGQRVKTLSLTGLTRRILQYKMTLTKIYVDPETKLSSMPIHTLDIK